jgi:hypothetical protein
MTSAAPDFANGLFLSDGNLEITIGTSLLVFSYQE